MALLRAGLLLTMLAWAGTAPAGGIPERQLLVLGGEPEKARACLPLKEGEPIYLEFINSIYLAPVRESLVYIDGEGIFVVRVESPSAGVFEYYGLEPDGTGSATLHRKVGDIRIRSSSYKDHRLIVGGRTLHLKDVAAAAEPLAIRVRPGDISCEP
ncbi:MAG TPA: hypothetical protein VGJ94_19070 [Syntrophorhabdaceae bacterium]|jgi:hypothetical protein